MPLLPILSRCTFFLLGASFIGCSAGSESRDETPSVPASPGAAGAPATGGATPRGSGGATTSGGAGAAIVTNPSDWLFSEDFEAQAAGSPPGAPWKVTGYGAKTVTTAADRAYSGTQSAHFHVDKPARAFITTDKPFPIAGNSFYGRMMIWFEKLPNSSQGVHWDMVSATGEGGNQYLWGGQYDHVLANYHPGDCYEHERALVPEAGRWHCVEWQFDGPNKTLNLWLDNALGNVTTAGEGCVMGPSDREWDAPPSWQEISLGWSHYQQDIQANDVWIDDIVIDDQRIGCPAVR